MKTDINMDLTALAQAYKAERQASNFKYDAFISYRHLKPDGDIAEAIHRMIENYKAPKAFWSEGKAPVFRVFRDREELSTADLGDSLEKALMSSMFLIVICSKRLRLSEWCVNEVETFLKIRGPEYIIPVLIEGQPSESYPRALLEAFGTKESSVKGRSAVDLRPQAVKSKAFVNYESLEKNKGSHLQDLTQESLKILDDREKYDIMGHVFAVPSESLQNLERNRIQKVRMQIALIALASLTLFALYMIQSFRSEQAANRIAKQNNAQIQMDAAELMLGQGDQLQAVQVAKKALEGIDETYPDYGSLKMQQSQIFRDVLDAPEVSVKAKIDTQNPYASPALSPDQKSLLIPQGIQDIKLYDMASGQVIKTYSGHDQMVIQALFLKDGNHFVSTGTDRTIRFWNKNQENPIYTIETPSEAYPIALSPDNQTLYAFWIEDNRYALHRFDCQTGDPIGSPLVIEGGLSAIRFSEQTDIILVINRNGLRENSLAFLNPVNGDLQYWNLPPVETSDAALPFNNAYFTEDGTGCYAFDGQIVYFINLDTRAILQTYTGNFSMERTIIKEDGDLNRVYISTLNGVNVYEKDSGKVVSELNAGGNLDNFAIGKDETVLMLTKDETMAIAKTGLLLYEGMPSHISNVNQVSLTDQGQALAYSVGQKAVTLMQVRDPDQIRRLEGSIGWVSNDRYYSSYLSADGQVWIWDNLESKHVMDQDLSSYETENEITFTDSLDWSDDLTTMAANIAYNADPKRAMIALFDTQNRQIIQALDVPFSDTFFDLTPQGKLIIASSTLPTSLNDLDGRQTIFKALPMGAPKNIIYGPDGLMAFNYLEGNSIIYDAQKDNILAEYGGETLFLSYDENNQIQTKGVYNDKLLEFKEESVSYRNADPAFGAQTHLENDRLTYIPETGLVLAMRNGSNNSTTAQGYILNFETGQIIKSFSSKKSANRNAKIYASPDGKTIYYDLGSFTQKLNPSADPYELANTYTRRLTGIYSLIDDDTLQEEIQNYFQEPRSTP